MSDKTWSKAQRSIKSGRVFCSRDGETNYREQKDHSLFLTQSLLLALWGPRCFFWWTPAFVDSSSSSCVQFVLHLFFQVQVPAVETAVTTKNNANVNFSNRNFCMRAAQCRSASDEQRPFASSSSSTSAATPALGHPNDCCQWMFPHNPPNRAFLTAPHCPTKQTVVNTGNKLKFWLNQINTFNRKLERSQLVV